MDSKVRARFILTLVVITGIILSGVSGWFLYKAEERSITIEFRKDVDERTTSLHREMEINFEVLRSLAILFRGDHLPDWKQFSSEAKRALSRHQNIKALEWIPRIINSQRSLYESNQQQFPDLRSPNVNNRATWSLQKNARNTTLCTMLNRSMAMRQPSDLIWLPMPPVMKHSKHPEIRQRPWQPPA